MTPARERALRVGLRVLALGLGVVAAFAGRNAINADGISYLRHRRRLRPGRLARRAQRVLEPALLLAARRHAGGAGPVGVLGISVGVHLVNVVLFATALVCFEVFLRELRDWRDAVGGPAAGRGPADWTWRLWGYAVFLPASLWMVTLRLVTPDLLVLGAVLLTAALLARVCAGRASSATFVGLGLVLGVGYLGQARDAADRRRHLRAAGRRKDLRRTGVARGAAIALAGFAVVALPWIVVLSAGMGRLSLGEFCRAQLRLDRQPARGPADRDRPDRVRHARGAGASAGPATGRAGAVSTTSTAACRAPSALARSGLLARGRRPHFNPSRQARAVLANLQRLGRLAIGWAPCLLGLAVLAVAGRRQVRAWRWPLFALALASAPLGMYVAIHIEYRYIGAFSCCS